MQTTFTMRHVIKEDSATMSHATTMHSLRSTLKNPTRRKLAGFTLIELMIVVAIVAILSAIAIPAYQRQIMQSRRASAKTALLDVVSREEKFYATTNYYPASLSSVGYSTLNGAGALQVPNNTNEDYYSVTIALGVPTATGYTVTAAPVGNQANDSCGSYSITDLGVQTPTPSTNSGTGNGCW
jgi:type IV pilus assembly protein PilE